MTAATVEVSGLVLFRLGSHSFGVPLSRVRQIIGMVAVTPIPEVPAWLLGVVNLRGSYVKVLDIALRFGIRTSPVDINSRIIIVETGGRLAGLVVDEVAEVVSGDTEQANEAIPDLPNEGHPVLALTRVGAAVVVVLNVDEVCAGSHDLELPEDVDGHR